MNDITILSPHPIEAEIISAALAGEGLSLRCCTPAEFRASTLNARLLLLVNMPLPDALAIIKTVRAMLPIFALSDNYSPRVTEWLLRGGVEQYISLPVSLQRLRYKVSVGMHNQSEQLCRGL